MDDPFPLSQESYDRDQATAQELVQGSTVPHTFPAFVGYDRWIGDLKVCTDFGAACARVVTRYPQGTYASVRNVEMFVKLNGQVLIGFHQQA